MLHLPGSVEAEETIKYIWNKEGGGMYHQKG